MKDNGFSWKILIIVVLVILVIILSLQFVRFYKIPTSECNEYVGRDGCQDAGAQSYGFKVNVESSEKRVGVAWNHCVDEFEKRHDIENMQQNGFCTLNDVGAETGFISYFNCDCWYLN